MLGPGKYDAPAKAIREVYDADAVLLVVLGPETGASCVATPEAIVKLPGILRGIADAMDKDGSVVTRITPIVRGPAS